MCQRDEQKIVLPLVQFSYLAFRKCKEKNLYHHLYYSSFRPRFLTDDNELMIENDINSTPFIFTAGAALRSMAPMTILLVTF